MAFFAFAASAASLAASKFGSFSVPAIFNSGPVSALFGFDSGLGCGFLTVFPSISTPDDSLGGSIFPATSLGAGFPVAASSNAFCSGVNLDAFSASLAARSASFSAVF